MAKDPRFNFYVDNWKGGTMRMTFEQKGAYLELLILNFYCLSDGQPGFKESEAASLLAYAPAYAELWNFLRPKFKTDGDFFFSERMVKEFHKSKKSSDFQKDRANKRWSKEIGHTKQHMPRHMPVNGIGTGNSTGDQKKEKIEKFSKPDQLQIENYMDERNVAAGRLWPDSKVKTEAKAFFNHYEANGWMVGRTKMKNWQAAIRNWMNNSNKFNNNSNSKHESEQQRKAGIEQLKSVTNAILTGEVNSDTSEGE